MSFLTTAFGTFATCLFAMAGLRITDVLWPTKPLPLTFYVCELAAAVGIWFYAAH